MHLALGPVDLGRSPPEWRPFSHPTCHTKMATKKRRELVDPKKLFRVCSCSEYLIWLERIWRTRTVSVCTTCSPNDMTSFVLSQFKTFSERLATVNINVVHRVGTARDGPEVMVVALNAS